MEAAKYCGESQRFTYKTYVLIFEKDMRILSRNDEEMWDTRAVQRFLLGIKCHWFTVGKAFVTGSDSHKNNFAKTMVYLANFVQHGKGEGQKFSAVYAQISGGGLHGGRFGTLIATEEVATADEANVDVVA